MLVELLHLLSADSAARAMDVVHRVRLESWLPGWLAPFLVAGLGALCWWQYWRTRSLAPGQRLALACCRVLAYAVALFVVARPEITVDGEGVPDGPVPVIVDGTQSMTIRDVGTQSRAEAAQAKVAALLQAAKDYPRLRLVPYWGGEKFGPYNPAQAPAPDAAVTSLTRLLENGLHEHQGGYVPGVLLLTDGAHNAADSFDQGLRRFKAGGVPLYTVGIGEERSRDIALPFVLAEDVVFKGEKAKIYVNVNQRGYAGRQVDLNLYLGEERVHTQPVTLEEKGEQSVPVEYVPQKKGEFQLRAEIAPLKDEITGDNNSYLKSIRVIDERIKILMVFGGPTWEYRYLHGAFQRDNRVNFKVYLETVDRRVLSTEAGKQYVDRLPKTAEELNRDYDLVVMSAVNVLLLAPEFQAALAEFVQDRAGGLVLIADPRYIPFTLKGTPLEATVPVTIPEGLGAGYRDELATARDQEYRFEVTEEGQTSPLVAFSGNLEENRQIWQGFPPLYSCYQQGRLKPAAVSLLLTAQNRERQKYPALVHHNYGKGAVLFMGFDSTWRWRKEFGDRYFREFWGKVVQFLGLPHLLHEAAQAAIYVGKETCIVGERVSLTCKLSNPDFSPFLAPKALLQVKQGAQSSVLELLPIPGRMGMYRANYWPEAAGEVEFSLGDAFPGSKPVILRVVKQSQEFIDSGMNRELLERAAKETGGRFHAAAGVTEKTLLDELMAGRPRLPLNFRASLWDNWLALLLCLALFAAEWIMRKLFYLD